MAISKEVLSDLVDDTELHASTALGIYQYQQRLQDQSCILSGDKHGRYSGTGTDGGGCTESIRFPDLVFVAGPTPKQFDLFCGSADSSPWAGRAFWMDEGCGTD